ncbi:hypothetical protein ACOSP7_003910 [Xanthoceras sorbifolium]
MGVEAAIPRAALPPPWRQPLVHLSWFPWSFFFCFGKERPWQFRVIGPCSQQLRPTLLLRGVASCAGVIGPGFVLCFLVIEGGIWLPSSLGELWWQILHRSCWGLHRVVDRIPIFGWILFTGLLSCWSCAELC